MSMMDFCKDFQHEGDFPKATLSFMLLFLLVSDANLFFFY